MRFPMRGTPDDEKTASASFAFSTRATSTESPRLQVLRSAQGSEVITMTRGVFERNTVHENVIFCQDIENGLRAIVAIYSTALGPALGGMRFYPYESEDKAVEDVLNLSKGMAYKNALAGLDLGGGKAVIIGDPSVDKTAPFLKAYGRFVQSIGGRYITACDVGTDVGDMDVIALECSHVVGRSLKKGGSGDPSALTAYGVHQGMLACAEHVWGSPSLKGLRVGVAGVGKVGNFLIRRLLASEAEVVVSDVNRKAIDRVLAEYPELEIADPGSLISSDIDIYAPCALGGVLNDSSVAVLRARIVCGAANNQLAHEGIVKDLEDLGILYAPDFVVNAGGVIQVAEEISGLNFERAKRRVSRIYDTTKRVLELGVSEGVPPAIAANRLAEHRMAMADQGRNSAS